jgi:hypothetical protein
MQAMAQITMEELRKQIFNEILKASKLWYEAGEQGEALLFSQKKQVADSILQLIKEREEKCQKESYNRGFYDGVEAQQDINEKEYQLAIKEENESQKQT